MSPLDPDFEEERKIVRMTTPRDPGKLSPVLSREDVLSLIGLVRSLPVAPEILTYAVLLARRSRPGAQGSRGLRERVAFLRRVPP